MSEINVNKIVGADQTNAPYFPYGLDVTGIGMSVTGGIDVTGVVTATRFDGTLSGIATSAAYAEVAGIATVAEGLTGSPNITVGNIVANGDVSIAGTISYEDVTNVNSVGIITAQQGINVTSGGINVTGVVTATAGTLIAGVGIRTEGSVATAAGAKSIDFRGSGVTTAIFDSSSGISTVYIEGGSGGGGGAAAGFVFSYIMGV